MKEGVGKLGFKHNPAGKSGPVPKISAALPNDLPEDYAEFHTPPRRMPVRSSRAMHNDTAFRILEAFFNISKVSMR